MADGGFRPAYNLQFAADSQCRVIVGVSVTQQGTDQHEAPGMLEQVESRSGQVPEEWLMDGGYNKHSTIETLSAKGLTVYTPVTKPRGEPVRDPYQPLPSDSAKIAEWRQRMGSEEAKQIYQERASIIEWVNAQARSRHGLQQLPVRGLAKAKSIGLWIAVTHNLLLWLKHSGPLSQQAASVQSPVEALG
jgi:hypothetical protein